MGYSSNDDDDFYHDKCERSFVSEEALRAHLSQSLRHHYCDDCKRDFANDNALRQHRASKRHHAPLLSCARCRSGFVSASALTKHIEMGSCFNITNRQILHHVRQWEVDSGVPNLLTTPRVGWKNWDNDSFDESKFYATEASYNGHCYVCPICDRGFQRLLSLNQHLNSDAHEPSEFRCRKCCKKFRELSALGGHVESEACGAMSADRIQNIVKNFGTMSLTNG